MQRKLYHILISLTFLRFIEVFVPSQESQQWCMCMLGTSISPMFLRFFEQILELFRQYDNFVFFLILKVHLQAFVCVTSPNRYELIS
jgi:hypothetical protein